MKRLNFSFLMALAVLIASCEKNPAVTGEDTGNVSVLLKVSVPSAETKAASAAGESYIDNIKIFVFRKGGALEYYDSGSSLDVSFTCTTGEKDIYVLANAPDISEVASADDLKGRISDLMDNSTGRFVMAGSLENFDIGTSGEIDIPVSRLVARIGIAKIVNDFRIEQYRNADFRIESIYLVNVSGDRRYLSSVSSGKWYNWRGTADEDNPMLHSGRIDAALKAGLPYTDAHCFYCYPNASKVDSSADDASERYTRLVVETVLDGRTYYYPVSVPDIRSNCRYEITELVITRLGSSSPDEPVSSYDASFKITVDDWSEGATLTPVI